MYTRKRLNYESLIFKLETIKMEITVNDIEQESSTLSDNKNPVPPKMERFLKEFNTSKAMYNTLENKIKHNELPDEYIEGCYAPVVINLFGAYGILKNLMINKKLGLNDERFKRLNLDRKAVYKNSHEVLLHKITSLLKEEYANRNLLKRDYTLLGEIIYNYALYSVKVNKGNEDLEALLNLKIKKIPLTSALSWVGNDYLAAQLKLLKFDYLLKTESIKRKYAVFKGILNSAVKSINNMKDHNKKVEMWGILNAREDKLSNSSSNKNRSTMGRRSRR